jgi:type III secretion system needle length determinant
VNSATKPARVISVTTPARSAAAPAVANLPTESRQGAALTIVAATPTDVHAQSDLKAKSDSSAPMTHLSQWLHVPAANTLAALPPNAAPAAGTPVETSSMAAPSGTAAVASGVTSTPISAVAIPTARAQLPRSNKPIKISAAAASATEQPAAVTRVTDQPAPVPVAARPDPAASAPAHDAAPASDATAVPPLVVSQPGTLAANSAAGDDGAADDDSATNAGVSAVTTPTLSGTARIAMLTPQTVVAPVEAQAGRGDAAIGAVPAMPVANAAPTHAAAAAAPTEQVRPTLVQVLGERLQLEITKGSQNAVIRLDPASMGSIEISIRHDAGALQVHLSASNPAVLTQLQGIGDALRQDLSQRHQGQVSVQVSAQTAAASRDANGRPRQGQDTGEDAGPTRALSEADDGEAAGAIDWRSLRSSGA